MSEQENRNTMERYFQAFGRQDLDAIDDLLHDDYVEVYPQSGERIRGKQTARKVMENYPGGLPNVIDYSFELSGDLGVGELLFEYDANRAYICDIVELQDGKIKRTRAYFGEPFEAAEWRAQWVERTWR
jgi:limonene-1,2-epoxide hydrolase